MKLVTRKQMNQIDRLASEDYYISSLVLMEHAAHEIFLHLTKNMPSTYSLMIVCGSGNNGGDGFALARILHLKGYQCNILFLKDALKMSPDCAANYNSCKALSIPIHSTIPNFDKFDVIMDALFGTGLSRDIEGDSAALIQKINECEKFIVSIDIPSGIDSDNGKVLGCAIKADITYTMQCGKIGLYIYPGREYSGKVIVLDIYIPNNLVEQCSSQTYLITKKDMQTFLPTRKVHSNKGSYGKVLCIGGSEGMSGAISLAALSALRSGCGLLTCAIPTCIKDVVQTNVAESMSLLLPDYQGHISEASLSILEDKINQFDSVLLGCGAGRSKDIKTILKRLYELEVPLIIDADGLYALQDNLRNRKNTILTPHLKEFARLMNVEVNEMVENTLLYIKKFVDQYPDITLVLKSETTNIVQNEIMYINTYGNNGLATGGSGDVLAGIIAGLYAQMKDPMKVATLAVFLHAYTADKAIETKSTFSLLPSDIISNMEKTLFELSGGAL